MGKKVLETIVFVTVIEQHADSAICAGMVRVACPRFGLFEEYVYRSDVQSICHETFKVDVRASPAEFRCHRSPST